MPSLRVAQYDEDEKPESTLIEEKSRRSIKECPRENSPSPTFADHIVTATDMRTVSAHIWVIERQPFNFENARIHSAPFG
ncbi:hypothetical protein [Anaplasma phagocytophilum]|uniref:hypothetical protein n=1 Tax=Anaplasma phagocytophilum TaxID=948 RepID=UPI000AC817C2|nr:hypothetical protein [Anaplasma phagocytophilum]